MLERLFRKKPKIVKLRHDPFLHDVPLDVQDFKQLTRINQVILESENAFYTFDKDTEQIFRFLKPQFKPVMRNVEMIEYSPDMACYVTMSRKELEKLAREMCVEIFRTPDNCFFILTNGVLFKTRKG